MKIKKLFVDMDGVLVDFNGGYEKLCGIKLVGYNNDFPGFWDPINKGGVSFWMNLDWMPDGKILWNYIGKYKPSLLSAPSKSNTSKVGKQLWVLKNLPSVKLILAARQDKRKHARKGYILIDDRIDNIKEWEDAGGTGILHTSALDTINKLKEIEKNNV